MESLPRTTDEYRAWYAANKPAGVEPGTCWCGCGEVTKIPTGRQSNHGLLKFKGEPIRFIHGHHPRRFATEYTVTDCGYETPCWISNRSNRDKHGYTSIYTGERKELAHRVYYERRYGSIPIGHHVHHLCGQPGCLNTDHMEVLSPSEHRQRHGKSR